jgi:hypothetical protein
MIRACLWVSLSIAAFTIGCGDDSATGGSGTGGSTTDGGGPTSTTTTAASMTTTATTTTSAAGGAGGGGPFGCLGDPLPNTAPAMITLGGASNTVGINGQTPLAGVLVEVFQGASTTPITTATTDAQGAYTTMLTTGGTPLDGYIKGTKATYKDTYVYPPYPLYQDVDNAAVLLITQNTFTLLNGLSGAQDQAPTNGFIGVLVVDCDNNPVAGATVSSNPPGSDVRYNQDGIPNGTPTSTDTDGLAYIFNVPAGMVTVDAMAGGNSLREHTINARANVITTTIVAP